MPFHANRYSPPVANRDHPLRILPNYRSRSTISQRPRPTGPLPFDTWLRRISNSIFVALSASLYRIDQINGVTTSHNFVMAGNPQTHGWPIHNSVSPIAVRIHFGFDRPDGCDWSDINVTGHSTVDKTRFISRALSKSCRASSQSRPATVIPFAPPITYRPSDPKHSVDTRCHLDFHKTDRGENQQICPRHPHRY